MFDSESELSVYKQLAEAIRGRIEAGQYRRRLPTVTTLEQEFGVARNTVLQAMAYLRDLGIVYTVRNRGSFVAARTHTAEARPGARVITREATETEREELRLDDGVWVLVVEQPDGQVDVLPGHASEVRIAGDQDLSSQPE